MKTILIKVKAWFQRFQFKRLTTKLLIYYAGLFILSFLFISLLIYQSVSTIIVRLELNRQTSMLSQLAEGVDSRLHDAYSFTSLVYYNPGFIETLLDNEDTSSSYNALNNYLFSVVSTNSYLYSIRFYAGDKLYASYRTTKRYMPNKVQDDPAWAELLINASGRALLLGEYIADKTSTESSYATIGRQITSSDGQKSLGLLLMDVDIQEPFLKYTGLFADNPYVRKSATEARGSFVMVSDTGASLVQTDETQLEFIEAVIDSQDDTLKINFDNSTYLILARKLSYANWTVIYYLNELDLLEELHDISYLFFLISVGIGAIGAAVLAKVMRRVSKRLNLFLDGINRFRANELEVVLQDNYGDEISALVAGFNEMTREIRRLIRQVYLLQIKQKAAELAALENQINPHFIYNTLENIQMMAVIDGNRKVATMISDLGKLIRRNLETKGDYITIEEELDFVTAYVELLQMRFPDSFDYVVTLDPKLRQQRILKFLIQPLVENAIIHGIQKTSRHGLLSLSIQRQTSNMIIVISDNGSGMSNEQHMVLEQQLHTKVDGDLTHKHIGLQNVNDRIKLTYGDAFGIVFESEIDAGTKIILTLPHE